MSTIAGNRIEVMHGVNLDQLGRRDPAHYGSLGLLGVAEVCQEGACPRADQREAVGAAVAGQVADVDEVRDQQQVDTDRLQLVGQALCACAHPVSSFSRIFSASRYPSAPLPDTVATHRSDTTEVCRQASRVDTAER